MPLMKTQFRSFELAHYVRERSRPHLKTMFPSNSYATLPRQVAEERGKPKVTFLLTEMTAKTSIGSAATSLSSFTELPTVSKFSHNTTMFAGGGCSAGAKSKKKLKCSCLFDPNVLDA